MKYSSYITSQTEFYINLGLKLANSKNNKEEFTKQLKVHKREFTNKEVLNYLNDKGILNTDIINDIQEYYEANAGEFQKLFINAIENGLQSGDKITILQYGEFGGINCLNCTLDTIDLTTYAQYDDAVKIIFTPKRARSKRGFYKYRFKKDNTTIAIFKGWFELPKDFEYITVKQDDNVTIKKSKYTCFDSRLFIEAVEHIKTKSKMLLIG